MLKNLDAYKLKWIAVIGMFFNHAVIALSEIIPYWLQFPLYAVGGLTFPIMAFFVVEGYKHTSSVKRYLLRLLIIGVIAQVPHLFVFRAFALNIIFTIIMGIFALLLYDKMQRPVVKAESDLNDDSDSGDIAVAPPLEPQAMTRDTKTRPLFWVIFAIIALVSAVTDWPVIGVVIILMYHIISKESKRRTLPAIVSGVFYFVISLFGVFGIWAAKQLPEAEMEEMLAGTPFDLPLMIVSLTFIVGCIIAAFLLRGYNGERGKRAKYLFYIFYPVHLVVLGAIAYALGFVDLAAIFGGGY